MSECSMPGSKDRPEWQESDAGLSLRYEEIWRAFLRASAQETCCATDLSPRWLTGSGVYLNCLFRLSPHPEIVRMIRQVQARLEPYGVLLAHPEHFLHITVRMFGEAIQSCEEECEVLDPAGRQTSSREVDGVLRDCLAGAPAFRMELSGVNSWPVAPFVQIFDGGGIAVLRERIGACLPEMEDRRYGGGFLPHLTLGYYRPGADLAGVAREIAGMRDLTIGEFTPEVVELVWGRGGSPYPELITIGEYWLA